jgi:large subunit ribosomal protein L24
MPKRIKKGDTVICLSGKDRGRKGKVLKIVPDGDRVVVEKLNVAKKHRRPTREFKGGIIEMPLPIVASKLQLVCPRCSKPTRVGVKVLEDGKRARSCKKCSELIDKV